LNNFFYKSNQLSTGYYPLNHENLCPVFSIL
jgi:hypothetical protein